MKLNNDFYQLPLHFEVEPLQQEISQFTDHDWCSRSVETAGNAAIILVAVGGQSNDDFAITGQMATTAILERCPYLKQVLTAFNSPVSRCRLVRLTGNSETPPHSEINYHWFRHLPIYIPIQMATGIKLLSEQQSIEMAAGEAWTVDTTRPHWMLNPQTQDCIHLVVELRMSAYLATLLSSSEKTVQTLSYLSSQTTPVPVESYRFEVLTPSEISELTSTIRMELAHSPRPNSTAIVNSLIAFNQQWQATFVKFGHDSAGELAYQDLILQFNEQILAKVNSWLVDSDAKHAAAVISTMLLTAPLPPKRFNRQILAKLKQQTKLQSESPVSSFQNPVFDKPIFIVSAPRAGSTLLFETLSQFSQVWSIAEESHEAIEGIAQLHPAAKNFSSNRLTAAEAVPEIASMLRERFARQLQNREGEWYLDQLKLLTSVDKTADFKVRFLEKTPKNALRIPFLKAVFPDALFIYLYRDPQENIYSLMEGWRLRRFVAYRPLPGWPYQEWSFLLTPGWESLKNAPLVEIAAYQWKIANTYILDDLQRLPKSGWSVVRYADLIRDTKRILNEIGEFAGLEWDAQVEQRVAKSLPVSRFTLSAPSPNKWRKQEQEISQWLPELAEIIARVERIA